MTTHNAAGHGERFEARIVGPFLRLERHTGGVVIPAVDEILAWRRASDTPADEASVCADALSDLKDEADPHDQVMTLVIALSAAIVAVTRLQTASLATPAGVQLFVAVVGVLSVLIGGVGRITVIGRQRPGLPATEEDVEGAVRALKRKIAANIVAMGCLLASLAVISGAWAVESLFD